MNEWDSTVCVSVGLMSSLFCLQKFAFNDIWQLDIEGLFWQRVASPAPPGRAWMSSTVIQDHWVVIGGMNNRNATDNM